MSFLLLISFDLHTVQLTELGRPDPGDGKSAARVPLP